MRLLQRVDAIVLSLTEPIQPRDRRLLMCGSEVRQLIDISLDQHANINIPLDSDVFLIARLLDRVDWLDDRIIVSSDASTR